MPAWMLATVGTLAPTVQIVIQDSFFFLFFFSRVRTVVDICTVFHDAASDRPSYISLDDHTVALQFVCTTTMKCELLVGYCYVHTHIMSAYRFWRYIYENFPAIHVVVGSLPKNTENSELQACGRGGGGGG